MNYLANFACAAILLASCSREDDMIGTYEADRYHFLEMTPKVIFEKTGFVANCTLDLEGGQPPGEWIQWSLAKVLL